MGVSDALDGLTTHTLASLRIAAWQARVSLHAAAGDTTAAVAALERLEAAAPESIEVQLARAFLGVGEMPGAGRAGAPAEAQAVATSGAALAASAEAIVLTVGPNPSSASATVLVSLAEAGNVSVVVYDLLGRAVAVPLAGALEAGVHRATLDTAALAPGVYVIRASANGGTVVRTARLTVAR